MRVLYLTDRLSIFGGADHHFHQIIRWSVACGRKVTVAYGRIEGKAPRLEQCKLIQIRGLANPIGSESRLGALDELLNNHDLIHVQNVMNPIALARATRTGRALVTVQDHRFFCPSLGKTLPDGNRCTELADISICRSCLVDERYRAHMLDVMSQRCTALEGAHLIVLSQYMADELQLAGLGPAAVIPPWVEVCSSEPDPGRGFVTGGRLVQHKASLDSYHAWRRSKTDHNLLVAGRGPLENEFAGAKKLGWLGQNDLSNTLHHARALLFPSFWQEPFGILGVQALAEGTPVIVAESGGIGEWAAEGCLRYRQGDIDQMAAAITELDENPEKAKQLGQQGRAMVKQRFNRKTIENRLTKLFTSIHA